MNYDLMVKKISSNHLLGNFFSKTATFTNVCQKSMTINFRNFCGTVVWKLQKFSLREFLQYGHSVVISKIFPHNFLAKFPSKYFFTKVLYYKLISQKFFEVGVNFRNFYTVRRNCPTFYLNLL